MKLIFAFSVHILLLHAVTYIYVCIWGSHGLNGRDQGLGQKGQWDDSLDMDNVWVGEVNEHYFPFPLHPWLKCS